MDWHKQTWFPDDGVDGVPMPLTFAYTTQPYQVTSEAVNTIDQTSITKSIKLHVNLTIKRSFYKSGLP